MDKTTSHWAMTGQDRTVEDNREYWELFNQNVPIIPTRDMDKPSGGGMTKSYSMMQSGAHQDDVQAAHLTAKIS